MAITLYTVCEHICMNNILQILQIVGTHSLISRYPRQSWQNHR